jgi:hypothetical protein
LQAVAQAGVEQLNFSDVLFRHFFPYSTVNMRVRISQQANIPRSFIISALA